MEICTPDHPLDSALIKGKDKVVQSVFSVQQTKWDLFNLYLRTKLVVGREVWRSPQGQESPIKQMRKDRAQGYMAWFYQYDIISKPYSTCCI